MFRRTTHHVRHNVVAYLALFLALCGSAMAAKPLLDGSDVADESLTTLDIQNDSLTGADIAEATLGKVPTAATADTAATAGDAATLDGIDSGGFLAAKAMPSKFVTRTATAETLRSQWGSATAFCLAGERVVGGGVGFGSPDSEDASSRDVVTASRPVRYNGPDGWLGAAENGGFHTRTLVAFAICATP